MNTQTTPEGTQRSALVRFVVYGLSLRPAARRLMYLALMLILLAVIWGPIGALIALKPKTYSSEWTLILPGTGNGLAVSLESIGQASASASSPFASSSVDPVVNYKAIAASKPVLALAAQRLGMTVQAFSQPKIKLVDQTSLMEFTMKGSSPELAYAKSYALYEALQWQLDQLRDDETDHLATSGLLMIAGFNDKLEEAQQKKLAFQVKADIVSLEQFQGLITRLEDSKYHHESLVSEHRALVSRIWTLQQGLNLSEENLKSAIALRSDRAFQIQLERHAEVHTQMSSLEGIWGHDHPQLKQLHAAHHTVDEELNRRGHLITSRPELSNKELIDLGNQTAHDQVLIELLMLISEKNGLEQRIQSDAAFIANLKRRIEATTEDSVALENLSRKQQVATAVFSTALAKQDIGNADRYSSYPLIQMLAHPTLPESADSTVKKLALIGGLGATVFMITGLGLLWIRKPWLQKLLKSA
ncbi:hypothetical protein [Marinobacter sp.]|uniref:hypothetical protein n=1 Tax=Marinobacter sp. TaxID=50741 RepID=UPI002B276C7F|nr:hypothetical protein [Marinobacter sp.]